MSTRVQCNETSRSSWGFANMEDFHEAVAKMLASFPSYIVFPSCCETLYLTDDEAVELGIADGAEKPKDGAKCPGCGGEFSL